MQKVEIPGGYATIRDKVNINGRKLLERTAVPFLDASRRILKQREELGLAEGEQHRIHYTETEMAAFGRFEMASVAALLQQWTLEDPLPTSIEDVGELAPEIYDPIAAVTSKLAWGALKKPKVDIDSGMNDDGSPILDSPTGPSTASDGGDRASQSTTSENGTAPSTTSSESTTSEATSPV